MKQMCVFPTTHDKETKNKANNGYDPQGDQMPCIMF